VYLAQCGYDCDPDREKIYAELRAHGYTVLPEQSSLLSDIEPRFVTEVSELLSRCRLSIHIAGKFGGKTPDGPSHKCVTQSQNELAAAQSGQRGLQRIIWVPEGARPDNPDYAAFVDQLSKSSAMQQGADLITGSLEDCKSAIRTILKKIEEPVPEPIRDQAETAPTVYFLCVEQDLEAAAPLVEFLGAQGLSVEFPVFSGDAQEVREANEGVAKRCDASILFFGAGDGMWKKHQENELMRVQGLRRARPMLAFTYLAAPKSPDKTVALLKKQLNLINGLDGFAASAVDSFIAALRASASRSTRSQATS
jgi:hypothetical protein